MFRRDTDRRQSTGMCELLLPMGTVALVLAVTCGRLDALETTWNLPDNGEWHDAGSWTNGIPQAGDSAVFAAHPDGNATIHLGSPASMGELFIDNAHTITFEGSELVFDTAAAGGDATLTLGPSSALLDMYSLILLEDDLYVDLASSARAIIRGGIGLGSASLTMGGTGTLTLDGDSSQWSGDLVIEEGTTFVTHADGLGDTLGRTVVHGGVLRLATATAEELLVDGGTITFTGSSVHMNPIDISSGSLGGINSTHNGPLTLSGDIIDVRGRNFGLAGAISGSGGLIQSISGATILGGNNSYTGQTIIDGGELVVEHANALGSLSGADSDATFVNAGGTLTYSRLPANGPYAPERLILNGGELQARAGTNDSWSVVVTGAIELQSDSVIRGGARYRFKLLGPITGDGGVEFVPSATPYSFNGNAFFIDGPVSYAGDTTVHSDTSVWFSQPLGPGGDIHVQGGKVGLYGGGSDRQIDVEGGELILVDGSFSHDITLRHGSLGGGDEDPPGVGTPAILTTELQLDGWGQLGMGSSADYMILAGGVSGAGSLEIANRVTLQGPTTHRGDLFIADRGDVDVTGPLSHPGDVVVAGATLNVSGTIGPSVGDVLLAGGSVSQLNFDADNEVASLVLDPRNANHRTWPQHYTLSVTPGNRLTVVDEIRFLGGTIQGQIDAGDVLTKSSRLDGWIADIGDSSFEEIVVEGGQLYVSGDVSTSPPVIRLTDSPTARLNLWDAGAYAGDIYLNHSQSERDGPALSAGGNMILSGNLHLHENGSGIEYADITGTLQGGALIVWYDTVTIRTGGHTYTGETRIERDQLVLIDDGVLNSTSAVMGEGSLRGRPELVLDNTGTTAHSDRIPDAVPVTSNGLELRLVGREGESTSETIGSITTATGLTTLIAENSTTPGSQTTLQINSLHRDPGSAVQFTTINPGAEIRFAAPPVLDNNILGGWAVVGAGNAGDYATYGPDGVTAYSELYAYASDINVASAADNVELSAGAALTANRTINSLRLSDGWDSNDRLDLNGSTLTIESGGILSSYRYHPYRLTGGVLTAGADGDGELIITASDGGSLEVESSIADNASGSVGVTVSSDHATDLILSGANTYTGATTLNGNVRLYVSGEQSLPDGGDVVLNGGTLRLDFTGSDPVHLGTMLLRRAGDIRRETGGAPPIDADAYLLESGDINTEIAGDGTITKAGIGTVELWEASPDYTGQVVIEGGALVAEASMALGNAPADDDHAIIIRDGGVFVSEMEMPFEGRKIILDGGTLEGTTPAESIEVRSPSTIAGRPITVTGDILGAADLTLDCHDEGRSSAAGVTVTGSLNEFDGDLYVTGYRVSITGNNANYDGDVFVSAERLVHTGSVRALGTGLVTVLPDSTLDIYSRLLADVRLEGGNILFNSPSGRLGGDLAVAGKSRVYVGWNHAYDVRGRVDSTLRIEDMAELKIMPQIPTSVSGDIAFGGELWVSGDVLVGGDAKITAYDNLVTFESTIISDAPIARLDFVGGSTFDWHASLHAPEDTVLTVTFDGLAVPVGFADSYAGVSGSGTVRNDLVITDQASVRPGDSAAGLLTIDGNVTIGNDGHVIMELGGLVRGDEYDALDVTSQAALGGTLDVTTLDEFLPNVGDEFLIISADHVDGTFSSAIGLTLAENLSLAVIYSTDSVVLRASLPGDFDLDGDVDGDDFLAWQIGFDGFPNGGAVLSDGDADGDGDVDGDDFLAWQQNFGSADGVAAATVPEPAAVGLGVLLICTLAAGRKE